MGALRARPYLAKLPTCKRKSLRNVLLLKRNNKGKLLQLLFKGARLRSTWSPKLPSISLVALVMKETEVK